MTAWHTLIARLVRWLVGAAVLGLLMLMQVDVMLLLVLCGCRTAVCAVALEVRRVVV